MNSKTAHILIVDDEAPITSLLSRILSRQGYTCTTANNAQEARSCLKAQEFQLVLSDIVMPGESGIDLIKHINDAYPDMASIMVTALDSPKDAYAVIDSGVYGYITKPFDPGEIIINVRNALRRRELEIDTAAYRMQLEQMVADRTAQLKNALTGIIQAMSLTVESRDPYTGGHQNRVAELAAAIASRLDITTDQIEGIRLAGAIHDLGKISVPAEILSKPTLLTPLELALIKTHPQVAYDILKGIEFPWPIAQMVLQHHEKMNGSGYPQGLSGGEIILEARIMCIADVVEAMASHRPYRAALGIDAALEEIVKNRGELYDVGAANALSRINAETLKQLLN